MDIVDTMSIVIHRAIRPNWNVVKLPMLDKLVDIVLVVCRVRLRRVLRGLGDLMFIIQTIR